MSDIDGLPEPDAVPGAPHPRFAAELYGQDTSEADFLQAFSSGRLHHGWLLTGPRGVGKATLAWAIARFLLATPDPGEDDGLFGAPPPPETLRIDPEHPVSHRVAALSEPGLFIMRRGGMGSTEAEQQKAVEAGRFSDVIRVNEVRKLRNFLALSATDGGRHVVIVDDADALNPQAANAILKMLEEPPARTTLLLISHQPAALLPTIKSRCRTLRLSPLGAEDMAAALEQAGAEFEGPETAALAALAGGSVGTAVRLIALDGLTLYRDLIGVFESLPSLDRSRLLALAESCAGRGNEERLALLLTLTDIFATRLARTGATGTPPGTELAPGEHALLVRLAPNAQSARDWADASVTALARARHGRAVNIDPAALVTDLVLGMTRSA